MIACGEDKRAAIAASSKRAMVLVSSSSCSMVQPWAAVLLMGYYCRLYSK